VTKNGDAPGEPMDIEQIQKRVLEEKIQAIHKVHFDDGDIDWGTLSLTSRGRRKLLNAKVDSDKLKAFLMQGGLSEEQAADIMLSVSSLLNSQMGRGAHRFNTKNVLRHIQNIRGLIKNVPDASTAHKLEKRLAKVEEALSEIGSSDLEAFN
jgi:hypothetical protein